MHYRGYTNCINLPSTLLQYTYSIIHSLHHLHLSLIHAAMKIVS